MKITDKMRLDWLSKKRNFDEVLSPKKSDEYGRGWRTWWATAKEGDQRDTLRASVDAAIRSEKGRKKA